jgi:hypothetical protein
MISFFVLNGLKRKCTALSVARATEIIKLMFPGKKAYVVEDNKIPFAHNMSIEEAEVDAGVKPQPMMSMEVMAPKVVVAPKKKADKPAVKKTKVKSKVVVKAKPKTKAKKTKVKSKVVVKAKPKTKTKAKAKPKAKAKVKAKRK